MQYHFKPWRRMLTAACICALLLGIFSGCADTKLQAKQMELGEAGAGDMTITAVPQAMGEHTRIDLQVENHNELLVYSAQMETIGLHLYDPQGQEIERFFESENNGNGIYVFSFAVSPANLEGCRLTLEQVNASYLCSTSAKWSVEEMMAGPKWESEDVAIRFDPPEPVTYDGEDWLHITGNASCSKLVLTDLDVPAARPLLEGAANQKITIAQDGSFSFYYRAADPDITVESINGYQPVNAELTF